MLTFPCRPPAGTETVPQAGVTMIKSTSQADVAEPANKRCNEVIVRGYVW